MTGSTQYFNLAYMYFSPVIGLKCLLEIKNIQNSPPTQTQGKLVQKSYDKFAPLYDVPTCVSGLDVVFCIVIIIIFLYHCTTFVHVGLFVCVIGGWVK